MLRGVAVALVAVAPAACSDGGEPAAESATTPTSAPSTSAPPRFSGDAGSPFCLLLRDVDLSDIFVGDQPEPTALAQAFGRLIDVLDQARARAPEEIEPDLALVADGVATLDAALSAVDYDVDALAASGVGDEVQTAVNDPAFTTAGERLSAYRTQVCRL